MGFVNRSPFAAEHCLLADEAGGDLMVVVAKATYRIEDRTRLVLDDEQVPIDKAGEHFGEPGESSVKYAPEADFVKPATDIVLIGHAHAPANRPVPKLDVTLRVGPVRKTVRVFGDRTWEKPSGLMRKSRKIQGPEPFKTMPLVYERAFGGADRSPEDPEDHEVDARNPVGAGFLAKKNAIDGPIPLPNLEDPAQPIQTPEDRPPPAGFGFIAPHWESRAQYAGTYDEAWLTNRMPLLPQDFQRRFFNAAHSDLVSKDHLKGGEAVEILNASPRGALTFRLPTETPEGVVMMKDGTRHALSMPLDTVIVNTDEHRVFLVWRGSVSVHKKVHDILWIKAQPRGAGRAHAA